MHFGQESGFSDVFFYNGSLLELKLAETIEGAIAKIIGVNSLAEEQAIVRNIYRLRAIFFA